MFTSFDICDSVNFVCILSAHHGMCGNEPSRYLTSCRPYNQGCRKLSESRGGGGGGGGYKCGCVKNSRELIPSRIFDDS